LWFAAALRMQLDLSERKVEELGQELDRAEQKTRKLHEAVNKRDREAFRVTTDLDEAERTAAELTSELEDTRKALLDKTTEALIESRKAAECQEKLRCQDEDIQRITEQMQEQRQELQNLRREAQRYMEAQLQPGRFQMGAEESDKALMRAESLSIELKATQELLQGRSRELEEVRCKLQELEQARPTDLQELLAHRNADLAESTAEIMRLKTLLRDQGARESHLLPSSTPSRQESGGDGLQAYGRSLAFDGSEAYRDSLSRHSPVLSLQEIADAPLPTALALDQPGQHRDSPDSAREGRSSSRFQIPSQRSRSANSLRRNSGNSLRGSSREGGPAEAATAYEYQPVMVNLIPYESPSTAAQVNNRQSGLQLRDWRNISDEESSDDEGGDASYRRAAQQQAGGASPGGRDLEELRRRLQSFKADAAVNILNRSQAVRHQLKRMQGNNG